MRLVQLNRLFCRFKSNTPTTPTTAKSPSPPLQFDTYRLVLQLERNGGFTRQQAVSIMRSMNAILSDETGKIHDQAVSRLQADTETYYYKAALHDMKSELATLRKTETAALESATVTCQRELDLLGLKFREDFNNMKSDIQLEMNLRKADYKEKMQKAEVDVQEMRHYMTISAGELKTQIEALKLELITKWFTGIVLGTGVVVVTLMKFL